MKPVEIEFMDNACVRISSDRMGNNKIHRDRLAIGVNRYSIQEHHGSLPSKAECRSRQVVESCLKGFEKKACAQRVAARGNGNACGN